MNPILNTDSYKTSHYLQYPPNTTRISSYIESRGGEFPNLIFFGLQMYLKQYLSQAVTLDHINEAEAVITQHGLPFHRTGWEYIVKQHGGYLPLAIEGVREGTSVPVLNVILQVINTDPNCYWLTSYIETALLRAVWYPTTVATISWHCKQTIRHYLAKTADDLTGLPYKLHDFGARGVSSLESAEIGGAAHLVNFMGTDTLAALVATKRFYHENMAAHSIPAAEHSTITSWGRDRETDAYAHLLKTFAGKTPMLAVVSDSYNLWHALDNIWGDKLKQQVIDHPGVLAIRPDSGDPVQIVTKTIEHLMAKFGFSVNSKGYRVLPDNLRIIQGDGVNIKSIAACLSAMKSKGQSADNISFGMGSALLQKVNRDTLKFAMKADAIERDGQWYDVYKAPATDTSKTSKRGRLALVRDDKGGYQTIRLDDLAGRENHLIPLFKNGEMLADWTFAEIRARAENSTNN